MKMQTLILFSIFSGVIFCCVAYSCTYIENTTTNYNYTPVVKYDLSVSENEFVRLVNEHRGSLGLGLLIPEYLASEVCESRNYQDIADGVNASHYAWERMISDAMVSEDNGSHLYGQNYLTAQSLFNGYMASPKHKEALENPNRTHIGTSFIERRNYTLITKY